MNENISNASPESASEHSPEYEGVRDEAREKLDPASEVYDMAAAQDIIKESSLIEEEKKSLRKEFGLPE